MMNVYLLKNYGVLFFSLFFINSFSPAFSATKPPELLLKEGMSYMKNDKYEKAIVSFQAAHMMRPNDAKILYQLGLSYYILGTKTYSPDMLTLSKYYWLMAIPLFPEGNMLRNTLEDLVARHDKNLQEIKSYLNAKREYEQLGTLESGLNYAGELEKTNATAEAHELYGKLSVLYPDDPRPYTHWAGFVKNQGRLGWGLAFYKRALKIDPDFLPANEGYAKMLKELEPIRIEGYDSVVRAFH